MTNDEKNIICDGLDRIKTIVSELVEGDPFLILTGEIAGVNVTAQIGGYLHYFKLVNNAAHIIFYPDSAASEIGEILSSSTTITVKTTPVPNDFGTEAFWVYGTADILAADGQTLNQS